MPLYYVRIPKITILLRRARHRWKDVEIYLEGIG
jgi:hypothetical protein